MAPYRARFSEFVHTFCDKGERQTILHGLVEYRNALRTAGIVEGFQWFDGSFVEDCERVRGRPPQDIDLVTFAKRPSSISDLNSWASFVRSRPDLFNPDETKKRFKCDAYFVDMEIDPVQLVGLTKYWFGLFSHQRDSFLWKGMVQVPLGAELEDLAAILGLEVDDAS